MLAYITRRLLQMIPILLGVSFIIFVLFTKVGEDPVRVALGDHATSEAIANLRAAWGLDKPLLMQYLDFLRQIVTFDYGRSYATGELLSETFANGALVSLSLTVPPFIAGLVLNVSIAVLIAFYRGSWIDRFSTVLFVAGMSVSYLVYIMTFQYVFSYLLGWFPISGYEGGLESISYLALPWIITIIVSAGPQIRLFRTVFLDETRADYVRTAIAKGSSTTQVMFKHIMRNAMIPILTYTVIEVPTLILGAFLLERFFSIPGTGDILITAINNGDFPVIKGMTIMIAISFTLFNLITDLLYAYVDPRVQLE
ncbi:MAG: ABC transporter permease [Proteobacteria bacterium]|nr:MAG: ABC transporter permease [Pseudomonadota bacterium]